MTAPLPSPPRAGFVPFALRGWSRQTVQIVTASLAQDAGAVGVVDLAPGWRLYKVELDRPARIRLYASVAQRTADLSRPIGTDPDLESDHGLFFEFASADTLLSAQLSPQVLGYCPTGTQVPWAITNLDTDTGTVTATLTYVRTE